MSNADYITNQDIMLLLAKRIKEYRLAARMSQKEMAEKSGVSLATISHFEQGVNQNMTLNNFISLLRIVGIASRIAHAAHGIEKDKQIDSQKSKEKQ